MTSLRTGVSTAAAGAAVFAFVPLAQAQQDSAAGPYGWHMWDGGWHLIFGPLAMVLFLAAAVAAIILLVRWLGGAGHAPHPTPPPPPHARSPLDILRERFARGQIDKAEFEERRRVLEE
jgi:putative membrane protein